jgi:hypothetical protein
VKEGEKPARYLRHILGFGGQPFAGVDELHKLLTQETVGRNFSVILTRQSEKIVLDTVPEESSFQPRY